ncbi:hypothetical protein LXM94_07300 [Rhizobium sp. TRM95111]|uniref:hypothetical protein n=1 Tax=Rhizobium alarense TaxID=2846851 RepID=UPI001F3EC323|nr:hypothetical protein [Rhizobium alarense]MCF3639774.1 hypothetical protein [Rhizobium alarense]
MAVNENVSDAAHPETAGRKKPFKSALLPLHEAAMRIADLGLTRSRSRTKDLVGMLLAHGARAWRSTQPTVGIHLHVASVSRSRAVRIRLR